MPDSALSLSEVLHTFSELAAIPTSTVLQILSRVVEQGYLRRGMIVQCSARLEDDRVHFTAIRYHLLSDAAQNWQVLDYVLPPDPTDLANAIEAYHTESSGWDIDWFDVDTVLDSFSILRLPDGRTAALPHQRAGGVYSGVHSADPAPGFRVYTPSGAYIPALGDTLLAAYRPIPKHEYHDSVEPWRQSGADYLATRVDSIFLRLAAYKYLQFSDARRQQLVRSLRSEIFAGTGVLLAPPRSDISGLPGSGGQNTNRLRYLTGLRRLSFALLPPEDYEIWRKIRFLFRQLSGVRSIQVSRSPSMQYGLSYWPARVSRQEYAIALGGACCNAAFVQRILSQTIVLEPS